MKKSEINEQIALILGFEKIEACPEKGVPFVQWRYPENWRDEICAIPVTTIPDFVELLDQGREIAEMYRFGIPTERFNC